MRPRTKRQNSIWEDDEKVQAVRFEASGKLLAKKVIHVVFYSSIFFLRLSDSNVLSPSGWNNDKGVGL